MLRIISKRGKRQRQRQTVIANLMSLISERYFPLTAFTLPEDMNAAWKEVTREWPPELQEAEGTFQNNTLYIRPSVYNDLASSDDSRFRMSVGTLIHELLHTSMRDDGSADRKELFNQINLGVYKNLSERIHLYFEECTVELLTIYIMVNDYGIERYWEDFSIAYAPAVLALAKYANEQRPSSPVSFIQQMITTIDEDLLIHHVQSLEDWDVVVKMDDVLSHPEWIEHFCYVTSD